MNILIADDDRTLVALLTAKLKKAGFQVAVAFDAMQAMMAIRQRPPHAILLDVNMPGGGGLDVLRRVRNSANTSHIPIVVITATRTAEAEQAAREMGAEQWFSKPIDTEKLCEYLRQMTGAPQTGGNPL